MDFEKDFYNYDYGFDVFGYKAKEDSSKISDETAIKEDKNNNQIVVRTSKYGYEKLKNKLSEGYKVKHITYLSNSEDCIVEYILEK